MYHSFDLRDKIKGMFAGNAIGDALGMPFEKKEREELCLFNDGQGVLYYSDPGTREIKDTEHLKLGSTTDDWQLTRATGFSLVRSGGFDIYDQSEAHIKEMNASLFGWGHGTMASLREIAEGKRKPDEEPKWAAEQEGKGCGNGIIMKISPFAALSVLTGSDCTKDVIDFGRLTHPDMRARLAAVPVLDVLCLALLEPPTSPFSVEADRWHEEVILPKLVDLEKTHMKEGDKKHFLSDHMKQADPDSIDTLVTTAGVRFVSWQTAAFTIGVYRRQPKDFDAAILEAVNAGGDTDTNASIVGGMVGATIGYSAIPDKWKTIPAMAEVELLTQAMWDAFADK